MSEDQKSPNDIVDDGMQAVFYLATLVSKYRNITARLDELREESDAADDDYLKNGIQAEEERLQAMAAELTDIICSVHNRISNNVKTRYVDFRNVRIEKLAWVTDYLTRVIPLMVTEDPKEAADKLNDILKPQPISKNQWAEEPEYRRAPAYVCAECGKEYLWLTPDIVPPFFPETPRLLCPKHFKEECGKSLEEDAVVRVLAAFLPGFEPPVITDEVRSALGLKTTADGKTPSKTGPKWAARIRIGEYLGIGPSMVEKLEAGSDEDNDKLIGFREHPEQLVGLFLEACFPGLNPEFVEEISKSVADRVPDHQKRLPFLF